MPDPDARAIPGGFSHLGNVVLFLSFNVVRVHYFQTPVINSSAFAPVPQAPSSSAPPNIITLVTAVSASQCRRLGRPTLRDVSAVSPAHSHRDLLSVDYGL